MRRAEKTITLVLKLAQLRLESPCQQERYVQHAGGEEQSDFHSCRDPHASNRDEM